MARSFDGGRLLVASHNAGKVRELNELLAPFGVACVSAGELGLPEPEETGTTFEANADLKALAAATAAGLPALADDSGLCVDALGGDPGIYSARWAGPAKDFGAAMARVLLGPYVRHGAAASAYANKLISFPGDPPGIMDFSEFVRDLAEQVNRGDLSLASRMLAAQAVTLDAMVTAHVPATR